MPILAQYAPPSASWLDGTWGDTRLGALHTTSITNAPAEAHNAVKLEQSLERLRKLIEVVPDDIGDRTVSVLQASFTGQHSIVAMGAVSSNDFLGFASELFPNSRSLTEDEERAFRDAVAWRYQAVQIDEDR